MKTKGKFHTVLFFIDYVGGVIICSWLLGYSLIHGQNILSYILVLCFGVLYVVGDLVSWLIFTPAPRDYVKP